MGLFKKATIKAVTKKRVKELVSLIELDTENEVMETLKNFVAVVDGQGLGSLNIDVENAPNPYMLFTAIIVQAVRTELAYDPSIGTDKDFELIAKVIHKELRMWYVSTVKKLVLRKKIEDLMGLEELVLDSDG